MPGEEHTGAGFKRPVRVLYVAPTFGVGGAQRTILQLIGRLEEDFQHTVVALNGDYTGVELLGGSGKVQRGLGQEPPKGVAGWWRVLRQVRPDLLFTCNWGSIEAVAAAVLSRACPVIHTETGFGPDEVERLKRRRVLARRWLLRRVYAVVVPSQRLFKIATGDYRLPASKVYLIENGVDCERFRPGRRRERRRELGLREDWIWFGYVGGLRPEKALDMLLRSFWRARLEAAGLVIVGDGPCRPDLEQLSRELGIAEQARFVGAHRDVEKWYEALDGFVLLSHTEQMPWSLLEAMASGLPAIVTDVGDCAVMLGASTAPEVIPPGDEEAAAQALRRLAKDALLRERLGRKNRERCERLYRLDGMVEAYRRLFREAAGGEH